MEREGWREAGMEIGREGAFQWSSSFCLVLAELSPSEQQGQRGRTIWGPISATTWPRLTILLAIVSPFQLGRSKLVPH